MTYYSASQFKERWYIRFKDFKDGDWRISIEDPTFSGTATELTGAENPFEWMGQRDEDQTACVCGSTGYVRIVVTDEADIAGIRPTQLNNRRVTATRNNTLVWQGFLKQEEYSQDWISAPYEVELPIVSPLELCKDIPMPSYSDMTDFSTMVEFLDYIIPNILGMSATKWYFNYNGIIQDGQLKNQWTDVTVCKEHYYALNAEGITSKKVSDVLESFFSPFGHISEYCGVLFIKLDKPSFTTIYQHNIGTSSWTSVGTISDTPITDIDIASTDNTKSAVAAPAKVEFEYSVTGNANILKMRSEDIVYGEHSYADCVRRHPVDDFDTTPCYYFNDSLLGVDGPYTLDNVYPNNTSVNYAQIIKGERKDEQKSSDRQEFSYVEPVCVMMNTGTKGSAEFNLTPKMKARTNGNNNYIALKIKVYDSKGKAGEGRDKIRVAIANIENSPVLFFRSPAYGFTSTYTSFCLDDSSIFTIDDESSIVTFQTTGKLKLVFLTYGNIGTNKVYYIVPELYYMDKNPWSLTPPNTFFFDDVKRKTTIENGGCGDDISVTFDSRSKASFKDTKDKCQSAPARCFLEDINYIDLQPRTKLELSEVRTADPLALHLTPTLITDNTLRYIPVAVGMNARDCTTRLTLVSTNL